MEQIVAGPRYPGSRHRQSISRGIEAFGLVLLACSGIICPAAQADIAKPVADCIHTVEAFSLDAARLCDAALQSPDLSPEDRPYALFGRGMAADLNHDEQAAIDYFNQALALKPDFATAYLMRGVALHASGADDAALADYARAIALQPDQPTAYRNRAEIRVKRQQWPEALGDLDQVVMLDAYDPRMRFLRGYVHERLGEMEVAKADYGAARALYAKIDEMMASDGIVPQQ